MRLKLLVVLLLTAVCMVVFLWQLDFSGVQAALRAARPAPLGAALLWWLAGQGLRAARLGLLVPARVSFRRLFTINAIGFLAINVVPLRLGELARPTLLTSQGVPFATSLAACFMERLLDMLLLFGLLLGLTWVVELPAGGVVVLGVDVVAAGQRGAGVIVLGGALAGAALVVGGAPVLRVMQRLPMGAKVTSFITSIRETLLAWGRQPLRALGSLSLTVALWFTTLMGVGAVFAAFDGVPSHIGVAWTAWAFTLAGTIALPTPGFFGPYELFCSAALWLWQVEPTLAGTAALALHGWQLGFFVALGALCMVIEGVGLRDVVKPLPQDG